MNEAYKDQVRLLLRVLPLVAQEEVFALKGGTAINLFERDMPRLSVDIDLTYLPFDDRATALANIDTALFRLKGKIERLQTGIKVTPVPQKEGNDAKLHCQFQRTHIKIEVNTTLRGHVFAPRLMACTESVQTAFETFVEVPVVSHGELYGGKLVAALDRQHPRDLFDAHHLLNNEGLTPEIKLGMIVCLLSGKRPINEILLSTPKDQHEAFENQFAGMAFTPFSYDDFVATRTRLNDAIKVALTDQDKAFLLSFKRGEPDWSLVDIAELQNMPSVQWKLMNIRGLLRNDPVKHAGLYRALADKLVL